ncbi:mrna cap guanine-n7 methyltransferase 1, partial [Nicotiana attenuata]
KKRGIYDHFSFFVGGATLAAGRPGATDEILKKSEVGFLLCFDLNFEPVSGDTHFLENESTKILVRKLADHYSARINQALEERETSPITHLRKLNNWINNVLIQLYVKRGDAILDLPCGKGGDLIKWDKAKIGYYVGIDIADSRVSSPHVTLHILIVYNFIGSISSLRCLVMMVSFSLSLSCSNDLM